jgi:trehalose 6-phosphate phosphatase
VATSGIKSAMAGKNAEELIAPVRDAADRSALLLDVDGTIAPIVSRPQDASVPAKTRRLLIELAGRYALVACVSGRRAVDARRVVGVDSLEYIGNHGLERLRSGASRAEVSSALASYREQVRSFVTGAYSAHLHDMGVRLEDKDAIWSFHWRLADDEASARAALEKVAEAAKVAGLVPHWGRKVLEIRPPLHFDKGAALESLLDERELFAALYAGDDSTDLDGFKKLRELNGRGLLESVLCVGVRSEEGPAQITTEADLIVEGPGGVQELLASLL